MAETVEWKCKFATHSENTWDAGAGWHLFHIYIWFESRFT